jgi:hypothetical protein
MDAAMSSFQIHALAPDDFAPLFALDDVELARRRIRRVRADAQPGFPCRISLEDAAPGEELLLLPFEHLAADTPYRGAGAIFVRRDAQRAQPAPDAVPESLQRRVISLRGYDASHLMVAADVSEGRDLAAAIRRLFEDPRVSYLHLHNAKPGCYAARVTRADG